MTSEVRRGEYKVAGGKLLAADVTVEDGTIVALHINGDFFLEPDDALLRLNAALVGLPESTSVTTMTARLDNAVRGAHLVGFSTDAIAVAVRRALGFATGWADHTFEIVHPDPMPPAMHLALDEVLTTDVGAGLRPPTLRIWEWSSRAIIIGSFQSLRNEVDQEQADAEGVTVVRRISGGGAMFVEPGNAVTYSLYVPASLVEGLSFEQSYAFLDDWVLGGLRSVGIDASYKPLNDITSPLGKIGGAAQKRLANGGVLHHVTMSYDMDADKMTRVLRIGREKLSDKGTKSAKKRVDPLRSQTGLPREEIIEALKSHFRERYDTVDGALSEGELARAEQLAAEKFSNPEWTARVP
ncbi:lipoate--protein ligase family protein [Cumulibacter manganitolerans]|uniref:lipoate--protein ligase family protein n=1 Tax=Cumulibacter manganitolerans TaxID=1884992 RepID=UPI001296F86C|nr:biotin/lipoate A/B protein ligase family protein [Cumulibacter manganitolerans]